MLYIWLRNCSCFCLSAQYQLFWAVGFKVFMNSTSLGTCFHMTQLRTHQIKILCGQYLPIATGSTSCAAALWADCAFRCLSCALFAFSLAQGSCAWGWWISQIKGLILFLLGVFLTWIRSRMTQVMVFCMCKEGWNWVSWELLMQLCWQEPGPGCCGLKETSRKSYLLLPGLLRTDWKLLGFLFLCSASSSIWF